MHTSLCHSYTDDHRGQLIAGVISNSYHITLNTNTQPSAKHHTTTNIITRHHDSLQVVEPSGHQTCKLLSQFVETLDHKTDPTKLWRTIKAIDGKSTPKAENEAITFDNSQISSPKQIANYFNRQFTTSKLDRHSSSRLVSREIKRKSLTSSVTFTTDQVTKGIGNCSNTRAFGPNKLSIFHLKHLGSRGVEYLTALFNDSVTSCRIPSIWKSSIVIPIPKPGKALLIGLSRSSIQQRKLCRLSYFQPSTTTGFIRRPTRFPTRTLYHFCFTTTDE